MKVFPRPNFWMIKSDWANINVEAMLERFIFISFLLKPPTRIL